jgi:hypothetical protein
MRCSLSDTKRNCRPPITQSPSHCQPPVAQGTRPFAPRGDLADIPLYNGLLIRLNFGQRQIQHAMVIASPHLISFHMGGQRNLGLSGEEALSLTQVGFQLGISRERVRQLELQALKLLRQKHQDLGVFVTG